MSTLSLTSTETDTSVLLDLDFTPDLPCEHSTHATLHRPNDPAAWVVFNVCPSCGRWRRYLLCDSGHELFMAADAMFECEFCAHIDFWPAFARNVERLELR